MLPDNLTVTRSAVIAANMQQIHEQIASLREWPEWSPWNEHDMPIRDFSFEGPEDDVSAKWFWKGDDGDGMMEIVESDPSSGLRYRVIIGGFVDNGMISLVEDTLGTKVTWVDESSIGMGPLGGWLKVFLGSTIEKELGSNQEKALLGLKKRVEIDSQRKDR
jgi:hypothetical protein